MVSSIANNTKFDTLTVGTNTSKQFVIQNTGTAPLSISAISFTGNNTSDFTLVASPAFPLNIAAAGSQTVTVKFAPSAAGLRTATINIASNDADEVLYDFVLEGAGKVINAISSINTVNGISLFPNPSENIANLSFNLKTDEKVSVKVYDLQGKLLINNVEQLMNAGEQKVALNTATLASGKYIVSLTVGTQSANINLVVAH